MSLYLSDHQFVHANDNDIELKNLNEEHLQAMAENGLPPKLITHIAALFRRAPVPAYENELEHFSKECGEVGESPQRKYSAELLEETKENPE